MFALGLFIAVAPIAAFGSLTALAVWALMRGIRG